MLKEMKTHCHLKPGQKGTRRLVEQYGKSLLCVRYRYDENRGVRLKTVEIIVEEKPWQPPFRFRDGDIAPVKVEFGETELREKLRKARAKWDPQAKLWLVPYRLIRGTELETRIPEEFMDGSKRL
ncbi:hypothetical protein KI811_17370 [Geobacter hydrogenophilus]|uniref:Uncharacterized protein n=1 Tax=Geobacter hydrogenophilus TaxID=40983 RepID=A0A9W6FYR7_9BACT|nr:hypothetical protein [Geobacter hydrogenophilus]MBT0895579.1 hypothetical protein [Geobacter hydrogenophilus]GLI37297.1 hypothetical protein GHYDROH2_07980 [Geobacter hydrogenophilus]